MPRNEISESPTKRSSRRQGLTEPWEISVLKDAYLYAIQNRTFFRLWGTLLAQPIWRMAAFHLWTTATKKYSSAQKHIAQQGHRRKPNTLVNGCLDPSLQESDEIESSFAFSSRRVPFQGFHSLKSAVWFDRLPCSALCSCGCFGAVFILAFFSCARDLWGPCLRPVAVLVQGHLANSKSTSENS